MLTVAKKTETIVVPTLSLKEIASATTQERAAVVNDLEATEQKMKGGEFETYSPAWLHSRFLKIYGDAS